ncbi:MAG TPA: IS5 family transposase [Methylomirabilota bacterium]|nr:IS5 family transposase [Methylomirabilota bacterium]
MRGRTERQPGIFHYFQPDELIPEGHPLRPVKAWADQALRTLEPVLATMYSERGRPSIPPEQLLKSQLLIAFYSVRSDRLFCEQLAYNFLFRWFLDLAPEAAPFDASTFSKNRERLLAHDVAHQFFDAVVRQARGAGLLADEHFSVDGTLIEAWASLKSFRPTRRDDAPPPDDPGNPTVDFRGEQRTNTTHQSTTDPEARLARKGAGREAKLAYAGHALLDHRHGLVVDLAVTPATGTAEREAALALLRRQARKRIRPQTLAADRAYHTRAFIAELRTRGVRPHIARFPGRRTPGLDGRTTRHRSYETSQRWRKRVEEVWGWAKTVGGLRKSRFVGRARTELYVLLVGTAYNLLRLSRLAAAPG